MGMTKEQLRTEIEARFENYTSFITAYNKAGGNLTASVLSHQFSGERGLSSFSQAAYTFFFKLYDQQ